MEPFIVLLAPLRLLAPLDSGFSGELQQLANEFNEIAAQLVSTADNVIIDLTKLAYVTALLLGLFLYFTRLARRLGRELIIGGIILAILVQFVFPSISSL